jgi:PST family polysaccharide transporter
MKLNSISSIKAGDGIFKTTIIFSFIRVITISTRVLINKIVSVLLGASGVGILGLFYSTLDLIKSLFSLGIPQSLVRDVSITNANPENNDFSKILFLSKRIVLLTAFVGGVFTILLSPLISQVVFGNSKFTISFSFLSIAVFASMVNDGQIAILRGLRNFRSLAIATLFGALVGLLLDLPIYYYLRENGIIPSLIISSVSGLVFTWWLVSRLKILMPTLSLVETIKSSREMIRLGISLAFITVLGMFSNLLIRLIINNCGSVAQVGIYESGFVMLNTYFGVIMSALNTDFYPKMFSIGNSKDKMTELIDKQLQAALIMLTPLICIFIFIMSFIIPVLYSREFMESMDYLRFAIFSLLFNIYSDTLGIVFIVKNEKKTFILLAVNFIVLILFFAFFGYINLGIKGIGISTFCASLINMVLTICIVFKRHKIGYSRSSKRIALFSISFVVSAIFINELTPSVIKNYMEILIVVFSLLFSFSYLKNNTGIKLSLRYLLRRK